MDKSDQPVVLPDGIILDLDRYPELVQVFGLPMELTARMPPASYWYARYIHTHNRGPVFKLACIDAQGNLQTVFDVMGQGSYHIMYPIIKSFQRVAATHKIARDVLAQQDVVDNFERISRPAKIAQGVAEAASKMLRARRKKSD